MFHSLDCLQLPHVILAKLLHLAQAVLPEQPVAVLKLALMLTCPSCCLALNNMLSSLRAAAHLSEVKATVLLPCHSWFVCCRQCRK